MKQQKAVDMARKYWQLMDSQRAVYTEYAKKFDLTANELFVLYLVWFAPEGCPQSAVCEQLSLTKQTVSAILKKFWKLGCLSLTESKNDRRNKVVRFTEKGRTYAERILPQAIQADADAMSAFSESDLNELMRLTEQYYRQMKEKFKEAQDVTNGAY